MFENTKPIEVGMRVRVDHPTSVLHKETGSIKEVRAGETPQALFVSEQFPQCDPMWLDCRIITPIPKESDGSTTEGD